MDGRLSAGRVAGNCTCVVTGHPSRWEGNLGELLHHINAGAAMGQMTYDGCDECLASSATYAACSPTFRPSGFVASPNPGDHVSVTTETPADAAAIRPFHVDIPDEAV